MAKKITTIGGQALMEGIMMVGPTRTTAAFCSESGVISTEDLSVSRITKKYPILGKPFIRGIFSMIDTFRLGYKALSLSADKVTEDLGAEELTKEMAQTFIRKIVCYGSDRFEVEYTFAGELAELVEKGGDGAA